MSRHIVIAPNILQLSFRHKSLLKKIEEWLNMNEYNYMGYDYKNNQPIAKTDVERRIFRHLAMGNYIKYEYGDDGILCGTLMVVRQV